MKTNKYMTFDFHLIFLSDSSLNRKCRYHSFHLKFNYNLRLNNRNAIQTSNSNQIKGYELLTNSENFLIFPNIIVNQRLFSLYNNSLVDLACCFSKKPNQL